MTEMYLGYHLVFVVPELPVFGCDRYRQCVNHLLAFLQFSGHAATPMDCDCPTAI
jgi:hypothetical protein